jgi:bud site selection protein 20
VDFDKPGLAQHYCLHCAKYFINDRAMQDHFRTKKHKLRLKALEMDPYTIEESERAAGKGNFIQPKKRKLETQPTKEELASGSKTVKVEYLTDAELAAAEQKKRKRQKTDKDGDATMD